MKVDGATRGIRCAAKNGAWWCSRDAGHPGAHESRNSDGRGLVGWWNAEYLRSEERASDTISQDADSAAVAPLDEPRWAEGLEARLIAESSDPRPRCVNCARRVVVEFVAPSDLWKAAAREYASDHLCISCFDERVPDDWPIQWESVCTLWPISKKRAMEEAGRGIPR